MARGWACLGQGDGHVWAPWDAQSHSSRRQGSSSASGSGQTGGVEASRGSRATLEVPRQVARCRSGVYGVRLGHKR